MQLDDLKALIPEPLSSQLDRLYSDFTADSGPRGVARFLAHLYHTQQIDQQTLGRIHSYYFPETATPTPDEDDTISIEDDETIATDSDEWNDEESIHLTLETPQRYDMLHSVGRGAMGEILIAKDRALKRKVAYKQMHPEIADHREILSRFLREVQITAQLDHPNIIPVYSLETTDEGSLAYSMKLIKGKTLKQLIQEARNMHKKKEPLDDIHSLESFLELFLMVCDAMDYSHNKGVIHRDLKPANIMIGSYHEVYVMDWGIARLMGTPEERVHAEITGLIQSDQNEPEIERTQMGQIIGTPRYMSPEQAKGNNDELDGKSDQFSLGLILFELVTLQPAILAKTPLDVLKQLLKGELAPVQHLFKEPVPPELKAIIEKATAHKRKDRYTSVGAMAEDIRRYLRGEAVLARPDNLMQKTLRWMNHHRQATLAIAMSILLISSGTIILSLYNHQMAMAAARQREEKLNAFLTAVSQQSQRIDTHFLKIEALLKGLAYAATESLTHSQPSKEPYYTHNPFQAPAQIPSSLFGGKISIEWPTMALSPGVNPATFNHKLSRLIPLRHHFRETVLQSHTDNPALLTPAKIQRLIAEEGTPVMWAHVTLKEGASYFFPGIGFNTPGYDARERPFYKLSAHKYGLFWGNPYFDPLSGPLLPCTTSIYDEQGQFLGVAGVDLRFKYIIESLMRMPDMPAVENSFLLDDKGQIILRASDRDKYKPGKKIMALNKGFETPLFEQKEVVTAITQKQKGGYLENIKNGQLSAYYRLNTLGWYYVAVVNTPRLLANQ